jgi:hypothetical protein
MTGKWSCVRCDRELSNGFSTRNGECIACYERQRRARHHQAQVGVCVICHANFTGRRTDARFCSNACRQKDYRASVTVPRGSRPATTDSRNAIAAERRLAGSPAVA